MGIDEISLPPRFSNVKSFLITMACNTVYTCHVAVVVTRAFASNNKERIIEKYYNEKGLAVLKICVLKISVRGILEG